MVHPNTTRDMMLAQGQKRLETGDVASARLFYQRAAEAGSPKGARILAKLYDAAALGQLGITDVAPDPVRTQFWLGYAQRLEDGVIDKLTPLP